MDSVFLMGFVLIFLLIGALVYLILENHLREKRNKRQLTEYEQELTTKLCQLWIKKDALLSHQYVEEGETYQEALERIANEMVPIEKEIEATSRKLTDVLIEKM